MPTIKKKECQGFAGITLKCIPKRLVNENSKIMLMLYVTVSVFINISHTIFILIYMMYF